MGVGRGLLRIGLRNGFGFLIAKSEELAPSGVGKYH